MIRHLIYSARFFLLLLTVAGTASEGKAQQPEWQYVFGSTGIRKNEGGRSRVESIAATPDGGFLISGWFSGNFDPDPGPGSQHHQHHPAEGTPQRYFCAKYDANGKLSWMRPHIRGKLAVANDGSFVCSGAFAGKFAIPGPAGNAEQVSLAEEAIFLTRYDKNGKLLWYRVFGEGKKVMSAADRFQEAAIDRQGNIYMTGYYAGLTDFDPGEGKHVIGKYDDKKRTFLAKFSKEGEFVWVKSLDGNDWNFGKAIVVDNADGIWIAGEFSGRIDLDPAERQVFYDAHESGGDVYLASFNTSGKFLGGQVIGETNSDRVYSLTVDRKQNAYLVYNQRGTETFVVKYGREVVPVWHASLASGQFDGVKIEIDSLGNLLAAGVFTQTLRYQPEGSGQQLESCGEEDIALMQLDCTGKIQWMRSAGGSGSDPNVEICIGAESELFAAMNVQLPATYPAGSAAGPNIAIQKIPQSGFANVLSATISGVSQLCTGQRDVRFSVPEIPHARDYRWQFPEGITITEGQFTNKVTVDVTDLAWNGEATVAVLNACGDEAGTIRRSLLIRKAAWVSLPEMPKVSFGSGPVALPAGSPKGGEFSGPGVSGGSFDPALAGQGKHAVTYTVRDRVGCESSARAEIEVLPPPKKIKGREVSYDHDCTVRSAIIEIRVWDNGKIDRDIISLNLNGRWILENYTVTRIQKKITVQLKENAENLLVMYAENQGEIPPNTAAVSIIEPGNTQEFLLKSTEDRNAAIRILHGSAGQ